MGELPQTAAVDTNGVQVRGLPGDGLVVVVEELLPVSRIVAAQEPSRLDVDRRDPDPDERKMIGPKIRSLLRIM